MSTVRSRSASELSALEHELRRRLEPGVIGSVPGYDRGRHRERVEAAGGEQLEDDRQQAPRIGSGYMKRDSPRVHLQQRHGDRGGKMDRHRRAEPVVISRAQHRVQPLELAAGLHGDGGAVKAPRPGAVLMLDLGAKSRGRGAAFLVAVHITDASRTQGAGERNRVQANRGRRATHDQNLGARMVAELRSHDPIRITGIVGQRAQRRGAAFRSWQKQVIGSRDTQHVGYRAAVTAAGLAEPERGARPRPIRVTSAEAPVTAGNARAARDLKRHQHPLTDPALVDLPPTASTSATV
jgi:hypothetical protein